MRKFLFLIAFFAALSPLGAAQLSPEEKSNIKFIITTLANTSTMGLMFKQTDLQQAGNHVDHVNPLDFLGYVFSDPLLKSEVKRIGSMPWNRFASDMGRSLAKADAKGELTSEKVQEFAKASDMSRSRVQSYIKQKQWVPLIQAASGRS